MYSPFQLALKYLNYLLTAQNGKGHGIHSPFVFEFVTRVLNDSGDYYCYEPIESLRKSLLSNRQMVEMLDLGAGTSFKQTGTQRSVRSIAKTALKPPKFGKLLFRMANHFKSRNILELGTSLGITTSYLASANQASRVITLEGVPAIAALARAHFQQLSLNNIHLVEGNFDETFGPVLQDAGLIDFAYIDGNHRLEPTLRYFEQVFPNLHHESVLVFDDIHWSSEMEEAWNYIKKDKRVRLTIDLFFIGIVFFDDSFKQQQHFSILF